MDAARLIGPFQVVPGLPFAVRCDPAAPAVVSGVPSRLPPYRETVNRRLPLFYRLMLRGSCATMKLMYRAKQQCLEVRKVERGHLKPICQSQKP